MKKTLFFLLAFCLTYLYTFSQVESKTLEIYSITEYIDGYVIKGINEPKDDTLSIISVKVTSIEDTCYEKLIVGKKYTFKIRDVISHLAALPPENFVIRIKYTVVWKHGDRPQDIPFFSENLRGLLIKKDE